MFPNYNKGARFLYPNYDRERGFPSFIEYKMKVEILSFSENLKIESFLDWIYEIDKLFDMTYVSYGKVSQVCAYKLKRAAVAW